MSLWSNNPELYDELVNKGMVHCLDRYVTKNGFSAPGEWLDGYLALVETMRVTPELKGLADELQRLASIEILETEQDYFGGLADARGNQ